MNRKWEKLGGGFTWARWEEVSAKGEEHDAKSLSRLLICTHLYIYVTIVVRNDFTNNK